MTRALIPGLLAGCFLALPAAAQEVDCANAMAQMELNYCAEQDWVAADDALNAAYKEAMALLRAYDKENPSDFPEADRLQKAQRAWITYRDLACDAAGFPMRGGSAEPLLIYGCLAHLTEQRTEDLHSLLETG
ncbi:lysozyme inhibitor LprI family protein [Neotabrizicola sp. VNH66]|uniref:lysozyme inhibitor LprI family protein n=1 Tax=Neotabrizicola sp. VNH66 TaxID=3400918 RepID=UPI003BFE2101